MRCGRPSRPARAIPRRPGPSSEPRPRPRDRHRGADGRRDGLGAVGAAVRLRHPDHYRPPVRGEVPRPRAHRRHGRCHARRGEERRRSDRPPPPLRGDRAHRGRRRRVGGVGRDHPPPAVRRPAPLSPRGRGRGGHGHRGGHAAAGPRPRHVRRHGPDGSPRRHRRRAARRSRSRPWAHVPARGHRGGAHGGRRGDPHGPPSEAAARALGSAAPSLPRPGGGCRRKTRPPRAPGAGRPVRQGVGPRTRSAPPARVPARDASPAAAIRGAWPRLRPRVRATEPVHPSRSGPAAAVAIRYAVLRAAAVAWMRPAAAWARTSMRAWRPGTRPGWPRGRGSRRDPTWMVFRRRPGADVRPGTGRPGRAR